MIEKERSLVVDVDGTLCAIKGPGQSYADVAPEPLMIARLRAYRAEGWRIVLHSARGMRSNDGNVGQITHRVLPTLIAWLDRHNVPYDELHVGKPWPGAHGFYIDDRSVRPREFVELDRAGLNALIRRDRLADDGAAVAAQDGGGVIAITMAGRGSRFVAAGYDRPKYEIEALGRPLFDWSMLSLTAFRDAGWRFMFAMRSDMGAEAFVRGRCAALGIDVAGCMTLDDVTDGQATTALLLAQQAAPDAPFAVYNIDTFVAPGQMTPPDPTAMAGWIPCFAAAGDHWSFARLDAAGRVVEVREKVRISPHATVGLYWFDSAQRYCALYDAHFNAHGEERGERYIAPMYNTLIAQGDAVTIADVARDAVGTLGTPAEVEAFIASPPTIGLDVDAC